MSGGTTTEFTSALPEPWLSRLNADWPVWARDAQLPPGLLAGQAAWSTWLLLGGRGAGKTRAGAEWVRALALGVAPVASAPVSPIALVAETLQDGREVMVEGVSGLLTVHRPHERPAWSPSRRRLEWANGAVAQVFSAEDPDSLRGPQFAAAWSDELAKWRFAQATWDMLQFGLRLGADPRQLVTTTPRPIPLLKRLIADAGVDSADTGPGTGTVLARMRTRENAGNLAPAFLNTMTGRYGGTRLGRQELDAELITERPDALFKRTAIEAGRVVAAPDLIRVVVAVDPPAGSRSARRGAACGIVAAGLADGGGLFVLADATLERARPTAWARRAVGLYHRLSADRLVAEANQGGDMVAAVIREVDAAVPVRLVHARRGKWLRAEPVAALYEQGRVAHVGALPALEDEMCDFGLDGLSDGRSPDRLDALVWALSELALAPGAEPRIRAL
ncbi:terminase family protein [Microbaculum sp. A6E488]|uniref:Terminase family protein n=1 Tax=Microbaculum marinisediminis TaxID=2931392 RepID=A0AAW5QY78_9HYPH|nr:terminase family protein [Microbaculum sp. A6E488]MCT8971225.1 terminase family protein [Microbaculum sp. A6E488]